MKSVLAEGVQNGVETVSRDRASRAGGREGHTMKYEVWVLEKRLVGENRWRQFFCDGRQEALDVAEGFIDTAEKIEVKPA